MFVVPTFWADFPFSMYIYSYLFGSTSVVGGKGTIIILFLHGFNWQREKYEKGKREKIRGVY